MTRRVVVTGMGTLNPVGRDVAEYWKNLSAGRSGIAAITQFDTTGFTARIGGEVVDFDPGEVIDPKKVRRMDRSVQFAVCAAREALRDAGLVDGSDRFGGYDPERVGVVIGSGIGGLYSLERQIQNLHEKGPDRISPFMIPMMIVDMACGEISIRYGLRGPNFATVSACASAGHAIGESLLLIRAGLADCMVTGGTEAAITPTGLGGFCAMRVLSTRNDEPEKASRPFDRGRDGFVMGEGAGLLVLESEESAHKRGAGIYAELAGYGMSADAYHITSPAPDGGGMLKCMADALAMAGLGIEDVDYINAHGTSTEYNDKFETLAIRRLLGDRAGEVPVSSTKSMTGHLLGAASGIESIAAIKVIGASLIPPTINYTTPDPDCDLDYVPNNAREAEVEVVLNNSFGFGGHNVCLVLKRYTEN